MSLSQQIINVLENNPRCQYNAYAIYSIIFKEKNKPVDKKKIASIHTELKRLSDRKRINRKTRGFYQAKAIPSVLKQLENPEVSLHGIKLECQLLENNTLGVEGISPQNNNIGDWLDSRKYEAISGNRWFVNEWWENRKITITIHSKGLIEIFIQASENPLVLPEFLRCLDWLNGYFVGVTPFKRRDVRLVQVGVARDFEHLRLEGVKSLSLRKFVNDWCQIYNKNGGVRFEHHLTLSMNLDEAMNVLNLLTSTSNGYIHKEDERRDVV